MSPSDSGKRASKKPSAKKPPAKKAAAKTPAKKAAIRKSTVKIPSGKPPAELAVFARESGPRGWFLPLLESAYTKLTPRGEEESVAAAGPPASSLGGEAFESTLQPGRSAEVLASVAQDLWVNRLAEYKRRKAAAAAREAMIGGPAIPGATNWAPLGPSVVQNGQAHGLPPVAGRIAGISVAPGGQTIYAASANGGVFRSDDGGVSWASLMDAFDVDPIHFASTSLACGAIAIDPNDPDRIYVGTGEGDTHMLFSRRLTNALPAYRGIGPIRSDDGGQSWIREPEQDGSPLAGEAFFALAVDPRDREHVVGATTAGLFQRRRTAGGDVEWVLSRPGVHSSVVVTAAQGTVRFYAALWGGGVLRSADGTQWDTAGTGFPTQNVGRIALGVQPNNPGLVYAMVASTRGLLLGVFRLDGPDGAWKRVDNPPDVLPVNDGSSQGDYDLVIAVDPQDANLIYLGGSYFHDEQFWPASVWRCQIKKNGAGYRMTGTSIGQHAHADVHVLAHTPGDPNALWVGCDGGVFLNRDPRGTGIFQARNNGLACLCTNFFAQHPTDPGILFCGLQDNGTARASGGPIWSHVNGGDGGYCLINWADPQQVLVFANGKIYRATDGGQGHASWKVQSFPWKLMTEPIVGPPYNPTVPAEAQNVAMAAGNQIFLSHNFGKTWEDPLAVPIQGGIYSLTFASATRFFAGTTSGEVFRFDKSGSTWKRKRLDDLAAGPLGVRGLVADIAIDWSDTSRASVYAALGGTGDFRHVWHFDGTRWKARSGQDGSGTELLDVEHNALAVDRDAPDHVYVGADIGVWHSPDRGQTWEPLPNGLPDAPVFDLQIHPTRRLLRAATHGRGMFELPLDQ